jgi:hypothetical protein
VKLVINEQEVASFTDSTLAAGVPALIVANGDGEVSAAFDNVALATSNE